MEPSNLRPLRLGEEKMLPHCKNIMSASATQGGHNGSAVSLSLLLLLTLAKTACANKVADFTATFMKNLASKMQLIDVVA